jgi:hypothetical protein
MRTVTEPEGEALFRAAKNPYAYKLMQARAGE